MSETVAADRPVAAAQPRLNHDEIGFFSQSLASARDQFTAATKAIASDFALGPRGPWIVGMVGRGPLAPHELADCFGVGRSLITAELARLVEAGLIVQSRDPADGRRSLLSLTTAGEAVRARLGLVLGELLERRLARHSKEDILLCARLLNDFANGAP